MKKIFFITVMLMATTVFAQTEDTTYKPVEFPEGYSAQLNIVYSKVKDWEGKIDLYIALKASKPTPVVINIHGGGWNHGVKE